jgi:hypothetical protein
VCRWWSSSFRRCRRALLVGSPDRWGLGSVHGLVGLKWLRKAFFSRVRRMCLSWETTLSLIIVHLLKQSFGIWYCILVCDVFTYSRFIDNAPIDPEVANPSFLRWFYHSNHTFLSLLLSHIFMLVWQLRIRLRGLLPTVWCIIKGRAWGTDLMICTLLPQHRWYNSTRLIIGFM